MIRFDRTTLFATAALVVSASSAAAWESGKVYMAYGWDRGCDAVNCYAPYTNYMTGHYSYLKCKDPAKIPAYRNNVLRCVTPGTKK